MMMKLKPEDTIIITRHPGIVEWLEKDCGITGTVKRSVKPEEVKQKHVIGEIPPYAAQHAFCVTEILSVKLCRIYGEPLSYEEVKALEPELFTYVVVPVVDTDPTDCY